MPHQSRLFDHIKKNAAHGLPALKYNQRLGESVAICGAGPSLNDHVIAHDEIWACNSALPDLKSKGIEVTHGFCVDQSTAMLGEWSKTFDVHYLVSSSVHPKLVLHLLQARKMVSVFHNYLGVSDPKSWKDEIPYETWLYRNLYPLGMPVTGQGLNSVARAVCLALALGYQNITVYGADCGVSGQPEMPVNDDMAYAKWLRALPLYSDGRKASVYGIGGASMCEAVIDGVRWHTRPDMVISAVHLLELQAKYPDRITYVGQTLPNALKGKDAEYMSRLPQLSGVGEVSNFRTERVA